MKVRVIANRQGGTLSALGDDAEQKLHDVFAKAGVEAEIRLTEPDGLADALAEGAKAPGLDALVAGGGDGTLSCAAGQLAGTDRPLGILPLGTLNHLARDAGIPTELEEAAAVIGAGHVRAIDVAEVNGRVFVNNSSVGLYPHMVRLREAEQERHGRSKRLAMLSASIATLRHFRRHRLRIAAEGLEAPLRTPLLFVGNNRYEVNLFALGRREALDEGELCLYAVRARSRAGLVWAGLRGLFGRLEQQRDFVTLYVKSLEVSADRPLLHVSADGEALPMETPLSYRIREKALKLIVPAR